MWKDFKAAVKIEAHEQAVWAVRFVGEDRLLTGELCVRTHGSMTDRHRQLPLITRSYYIPSTGVVDDQRHYRSTPVIASLSEVSA